jgi:ABC-type cobalamin/Fe3+-siderophores transport system ATPase subunit
MKIKRLQIDGYKNVRSCDIEFTSSQLINAVIGGNGSGKSNLIEAIIQILIGFYFEKAPRFDFRLEYETQNRVVVLQRKGRLASITVDGESMRLDHFAKRLRDGPAQVFYPELTLVYYSGECQRVQKLVARYRRDFQKLTRKPEDEGIKPDTFQPLFVQSSNEQSKVILLALFAHQKKQLLEQLKLDAIVGVSIVLCSPDGYDPEQHEPKLWNTKGAIRRIVAAVDETSTDQQGLGILDIPAEISMDGGPRRRRIPKPMERTYLFEEDVRRGTGIHELARRLELSGDNIYLALESLRARGIFRSVSFQLRGRNAEKPFEFDQLSEGEKQLLAVVGAATLTNQKDNLVLLDEPDTHLNPHWSWDYPSMLTEAFKSEQLPRSTVLMATHDPVMISGMVKEQVLLAQPAAPGQLPFSRPSRNPRGQGVANLLCSKEFFGLPSSLDKETQKLLDERFKISIKPQLTAQDKARLKALNNQLEILPGVSERDPDYVAFLRQERRAFHP